MDAKRIDVEIADSFIYFINLYICLLIVLVSNRYIITLYYFFPPIKVLQRIEDVRVMCDKRITNLRRLIAKPNRPIQPVNPEPAIPISQLNCNGDALDDGGGLTVKIKSYYYVVSRYIF